MTLILGMISNEYAVLASDRMVTWVSPQGAIRRQEDAENKAIVLCGHMLMGYTGLARLEGINTERWVGQTLAHVAPNDYVRTLTERVASAVAGATPRAVLGHAFLGVGFGAMRAAPNQLRAGGFTISNALTSEYGGWQPRPSFEATATVLPPGRDFLIRPVGIVPARRDLDAAIDIIRRYRKRDRSRVLGVAQVLVNLIRGVAATDRRVGPNVTVAVLPREAVPAVGVDVSFGGFRDPVTSLQCAFAPAGQDVEQAMVYGPAIVCPGMAMAGIEIWDRPPPWWKDPNPGVS